MNGHKKLVSRREILAAALTLGGYADAGPSGSVFSQEPERQLTPSQGIWPLYPLLKPPDCGDEVAGPGRDGNDQQPVREQGPHADAPLLEPQKSYQPNSAGI